jgi:hypothetical protein
MWSQWPTGNAGMWRALAHAARRLTGGTRLVRLVTATAAAVALLVLEGHGASTASAIGKLRPASSSAPGRGSASYAAGRGSASSATADQSAAGGLPPFFTDSVLTGDGPWIYQVRDGANGQLTGEDNQLYMKANATAALAGDRTYLVAVDAVTSCLTRFYLVRITATGKPEALGQQPVPPVHEEVWSLAATPDGKTIAYAASGCSKGSRGYLAVTSVTTGKTRRWSGVNLGGVSTGNLELQGNLSLSADGSVLGFAATTGELPLHWSFRVLRTSAPAGQASSRSRIVASISPAAATDGASAAVSADGQILYTCQQVGTGKTPPDQLTAYSIATGKRLRNLGTLRGPGFPQGDLAEQTCVLSRDASGRYLLVAYGITYGGPSADTPTLQLARLDLATSKITQFTIKLPSAVQAPQHLPGGADIAW